MGTSLPRNNFHMMSLDQIREVIATEAQRLRKIEEQLPGFFTEDFGAWRFDPDDLLLIHKNKGYIIPLERITTSACLTDWIFQVQKKEWCDPITMYALLIAFRCILDPQRNYCPFEQEKQASGKDLAAVYAQKVIERREEALQIVKFQRQAEAILGHLTHEKPFPLSLLIESVDFSHNDVLATLTVLERIHAIRFDRENRYIYLLAQAIKNDENEEQREDEEKGYGETLS